MKPTAAGLVALLLHARVVLCARTRLSSNGVKCCRPPVQLPHPPIFPVSSLCFSMLKPQPWEQKVDSMLLWGWTGFVALLSMTLSFGSYIVFTGLAMYTERVRSWYLDAAPDALLEGYLGCCGNTRDHCIDRCENQMLFPASSALVQQDCPEACVHVTGFILAWPVISRLGGDLTLSSFSLNTFPAWLSWDFVLFWCGLSLFSW